MLVNPSRFPNTVMNSQAGRLAIRCGIKRPQLHDFNRQTASLDALDYAIDSINYNRTDRVLSEGLRNLGYSFFSAFIT